MVQILKLLIEMHTILKSFEYYKVVFFPMIESDYTIISYYIFSPDFRMKASQFCSDSDVAILFRFKYYITADRLTDHARHDLNRLTRP